MVSYVPFASQCYQVSLLTFDVMIFYFFVFLGWYLLLVNTIPVGEVECDSWQFYVSKKLYMESLVEMVGN